MSVIELFNRVYESWQIFLSVARNSRNLTKSSFRPTPHTFHCPYETKLFILWISEYNIAGFKYSVFPFRSDMDVDCLILSYICKQNFHYPCLILYMFSKKVGRWHIFCTIYQLHQWNTFHNVQFNFIDVTCNCIICFILSILFVLHYSITKGCSFLFKLHILLKCYVHLKVVDYGFFSCSLFFFSFKVMYFAYKHAYTIPICHIVIKPFPHSLSIVFFYVNLSILIYFNWSSIILYKNFTYTLTS